MIAPCRLGHLFPRLPKRPGFVKRRQRLADTIEALIAEFAQHTAGGRDDVLVDRQHTGRVRPQRRDDPSQRAGRRRRLRLVCQSQPLLLGLSAARHLRAGRHPPGTRADQPQDRRARGLPGHARAPATATDRSPSSATRATPAATSAPRPPACTPRSFGRDARTSPAKGRTSRRCANASRASSGQPKPCSASNDHGARELHTLRCRLATKFLALTAAIALNQLLGRPSRNLTAYYA